ncbi:MAG: hypothetical protein ABSD64_02755 [Terriglobales bacterium]
MYLASNSTGDTWGASRDQSQEMAKDFAKDCPDVQVTTDQRGADYQVNLSHIEVGLFVRDNQLEVTDVFGNVLSANEGRSIKGGVKGACALILGDWSNQAGARQKLIDLINASFQRDNAMGYAEISGDKLTVHSQRASLMRFHMILASQRELSMVRRAGIAIYVYTNDADQSFVYDVKAGQIVAPATQQGAGANK